MATAIERLNIPAVHDAGNKGAGVRIGLIGPGTGQPPNVLAGGWDFYLNAPLSGAADNSWGTVQYGIIKAVAPEAKIYDLKITSASLTTPNHLKAAIDWAIQNGLEVLFLNYTALSGDDVTAQAIESAWAAGVFMCAGVGGAYARGYSGSLYPASNSRVFGVSTMNELNYSRYYVEAGLHPLYFYPVYQAVYPMLGQVDAVAQSDATTHGTYTAAAYIAGLAALVIAAGAAVTPQQIFNKIKNSAVIPYPADPYYVANGTPLSDVYGAGLPDAVKAATPDRTYSVYDVASPNEGELQEQIRFRVGSYAPAAASGKIGKGPYLVRWPSPRDGQTNVGILDPIKFWLASYGLGIERDTIALAWSDDYGPCEPQNVETLVSGNRFLYGVEVRRDKAWPYDTPVWVEIDCEDVEGNPLQGYLPELV